jgi:hypothetical protein
LFQAIQFERAADKTVCNAADKRAYDVAPKSKAGMRRLLR